jgi:biofilm PGA synthesis N-glycosyltransferase PgaC
VTVVLVVALALLAYTYAGYPLALWIATSFFRSHRKQSCGDGETRPMVSVFLSVHNGAAFLPKKIASLLSQDYPADRLEILIYSDGSTDDTVATARALSRTRAAGGRIHVIPVAERRGKPTGLNTLRAFAQGDLILLNDVRQPLERGAIRALADAMSDPAVGCATGNLIVEGKAGSGIYWRYENWIRHQESRFRGVVGMTGPIAMVRRADLASLPEDVILDDVWIPMQLALRGKRVTFVPEAKAYDTAFDDQKEFRRKVRTLAGNYQIFARMPALVVPFKNPLWFETVSHKVLRLAAPWLLLALALASAGAPSLAIGQLAFYAAALLGVRAGRVGSVARTFVVLNAAAVAGLWGFATGRQRVTWTVTQASPAQERRAA